jgi:DNA adenine methylase
MRGGVMGDANAWRTFLFYHLPKICNRFKDVKIFCDDGASVMEGWDSPTTTHFCDPPYLPETRTAKEVYNYEMTFAQHERFLKAALRMQGAVVISGYHHPLYDETLSGWKLYEFVMPNHSGQNKKKQRRVECLWVSK